MLMGAAFFSSLARENVPTGLGNRASSESRERVFWSSAPGLSWRRIFGTDRCSCALPDFLQRFFPIAIPGSDRSQALSDGMERAWQEIGASAENPFEQNFLSHWNPDSAAPALLLNTIEVDNGRRMVIAPFAIPPSREPALSQMSWFYQTDEMDKSFLSGFPGPPVKSGRKVKRGHGHERAVPLDTARGDHQAGR